ncbi:MAG: hypothetical protein RR276_03580 [Angelakisella sp.]
MPEKFTMTDYTENPNKILDEVFTFEALTAQANQIFKEKLPLVRNRNIDHFAALAGVLPEDSEFAQNVEQMGRDLYDGTPEEKKPWLDMVCDFRDGFDVSQVNLDSKPAVNSALTCCALQRSMLYLERENKDYFAARYADPVKREKVELMKETQLQFGSLVESMISEANLGRSHGFGMVGNPFGVEGGKRSLATSVANYRVQGLGESFSEIPFTVPKEFNRFLPQDVNKMSSLPQSKPLEDAPIQAALKGMFGTAKVSAEYAEVGILTRDDLVLIDGKSVRDIIDAKNITLDPKQRELMGNNIIATALTSGKNRVDAVYMHTREDGSLDPIVQAIKPDLTALGDTTKQDYNWFHRHLFNYGSHKCLTRAQKADALYEKPIPPQVEDDLKASISGISKRVNAYGVLQQSDMATERLAAQRKPTNAKLLQDEMAPTTTAQGQRLSSQQTAQKAQEKTL